MALPAWAIYAGLKWEKAKWGYLLRKKRKPFAQTEYGKHLKGISEEGLYTPKMQRTMLGKVGTAAGSEAQKRKAAIRGQAEAAGIGARSVAVQGLLDKPGQQAQKQVATAAQDISTQQQLTKAQAKAKYKEMMYATEQQRISEEQAARSKLFGGLGEAATTGYGAYTQEKQFGEQMGLRREQAATTKEYYEELNKARGLTATANLKRIEVDLVRQNVALLKELRSAQGVDSKAIEKEEKSLSAGSKQVAKRRQEILESITTDETGEQMLITPEKNFEADILTLFELGSTNVDPNITKVQALDLTRILKMFNPNQETIEPQNFQEGLRSFKEFAQTPLFLQILTKTHGMSVVDVIELRERLRAFR